MARQNNWRLIRNNRINTKDKQVWMYHQTEGVVALGPPKLIQEGGFSHWKRVKDWEPDPGTPDKDDMMKAEAQDIMDRVDNVEEVLALPADELCSILDNMEDDDDLPW
jgi:hypothetical protein